MTVLTVVLIIFLILVLSNIWGDYKNEDDISSSDVLLASIIIYTITTGNTFLVPFLLVISVISLVVDLFNEVTVCRKLVNAIIKRYYS